MSDGISSVSLVLFEGLEKCLYLVALLGDYYWLPHLLPQLLSCFSKVGEEDYLSQAEVQDGLGCIPEESENESHR